MIVNADLHIHSRYSGATSKEMTLERIAYWAPRKGIKIMATGDCLHKEWMKEIRKCIQIDEGTFVLGETRFILSVEVEDQQRVHHLIYFPSLSAAESFREQIRSRSKNLDTDGRPNIALRGEDIAAIAKGVDALIGPAHAFTPWTSLYAYYTSLNECYGELAEYISFVELGLSADSDYADRIKELQRLTFLSNSDSHSPHPVRLAREFTQFEVKQPIYQEIRNAILRKKGNGPVLNAGFHPEEGKYNESACFSCHTHYTYDEAKKRRWKCRCGKQIKKGVKDRISELATYIQPQRPSHRPSYVHIIPLAEIIAKAAGIRTPFSQTVTKRWDELIRAFSNEIEVMLNVPIYELMRVTTPAVAEAIQAFREQRVIIIPGGGGEYGQIELPGNDAILTVSLGPRDSQTSLYDYT
ncbi:MAG: TIGR00375 family protein [Candidatus Thermoplasmatota archaeon]|nr:TIGR00375 family protein [Candidatus Thermoplasmatota archaeon]MBU1942017.1 TIGR00375 family protein [Candidatus Thermoplasmatota archaeon]